MHELGRMVDQMPLTLASGLSRAFLLHHRVCPAAVEADGTLIVAIGPTAAREALDDLAAVYARDVRAREVADTELDRLIERLTSGATRTLELERADPESLDTTDVRDLVHQAPVVRYVNLLVKDAFEAGASDIHLEAIKGDLWVRFRLDGVLAAAPQPPAQLHHAVVSRLKLLADLDIAERRRPQDGRIRVRLEDRELDLRVATIPTMFGESVVLRLLDRAGGPSGLDELGMPSGIVDATMRLLSRPHGMVIVTGPTGSGKTSTLYAGLRLRRAEREKIITVEDPVEYQLPGITQVPVHSEHGVGFARALRAILRQDPDVVMIGEMRDAETAELAVQAAMTGHLVLTTLHTNDAPSAVPRLLDLGVPSYLVAATLEGVLAQRLVRRVCDECRESYDADPSHVAALTSRPALRERLTRGRGCAACRGTGYRGRVGVFELMPITDDLRTAIVRGSSLVDLRECARGSGYDPLRTDAWAKVRSGITTLDEVLRVIQE